MTQDRADIADVCTRVGWHADQREWDRLKDVFADSVLVDYTGLAGGKPGVVASEVLIGSWRDLLGSLDATQHLIGSHLVEVDGDTAVCTAQFQAVHLRDGANWTLGGKYRFGLTRTGGWRVNAITMNVIWETGDRTVLNGQEKDNSPAGVATRFLNALSEKDIDTVADCFAEEAVQEMPYSPPGFPGRLEGLEALRTLYGGLPDANRIMRFPVVAVYPLADPERVLIEFEGEIEQYSGDRYDNHYFGLFHVVDGKIRHYREIFNPLVLVGAMSEEDRASTFSLDQS